MKQKNPFKHLLLLSILLAASLPAFSQHFDWVKSYSGQERPGEFWNYIVGSVTDSHGNLYVAGQFANGATIDGQDLLPITPSINLLNSCIMKISPEGEILWKKILHSNMGGGTQIYELQLVGDTALFASVYFGLPLRNNEYLYFYDTLITNANLDYLIYADSLYSGFGTTAISAFDLDGHLTENYILHMAYKDNKGKLITEDRVTNNDFDTAYIAMDHFKPGTFCVDNQGNIYLGHLSTDYMRLYCDTCEYYAQEYDLNNGLISEIVVMVNGRQKFFDAPISHPTHCNFRIMKFSPHFNDMLTCRYVFENEIGEWDYFEKMQLLVDSSDDHVYLMLNTGTVSGVAVQQISGLSNQSVLFNSLCQGIIVQFNDVLQPQNVLQITPSQTTIERTNWYLIFNKMVMDFDSNSFFTLGTIAKNTSDFDTRIGEQNVEIGEHNAFFFKTNIGDNNILADGLAHTDYSTWLSTKTNDIGAVASNGRLFATIGFECNVQWLDTSVTLERTMNGAGVYQWSYDGHEIGFIDLNNVRSSRNMVSSSLVIHDSSLYICGGMTENLQFADTTIVRTGNTLAYIAKYVDTSFMTPYVYTGPQDTGDVRIKVVEDGNAFVAYPNPFRQKVNIQVESGELKVESGVATAWLTDMQGRREEVRLTPAGNGKYTLDLTSRPQATYLLTLTTATGKTHTLRLLKHSDIFSR